MNRSTVWISGVGCVSGAGGDVASTLETFRTGKRNCSAPIAFQTTLSCPTFQSDAELPVLPEKFNHSRTLRLTLRAVNEALAQSGNQNFAADIRVGVALGTTIACQLNSIPFYAAFRNDQQPPLDPVYDFLNTNLAAATAQLLGVTGPRMTVVNACSSGTDAIGIAASWIRNGLCDVAIAGGADELYRVPLAGFWSLGVTSAEPCAPFDRDRTGLNLGEGAGILILESEAHAKKRGVKPEFEVAGFGSACDAHHLTAPHPQGRGLTAAIRAALTQANLLPENVSFINAHGTATLDNDRAEGKVISATFGRKTPFLSTKGYTGHTLGAAGGVEAVFSVLGLHEGWIPASAGFQNQADDIAVSPVRERTPIDGTCALSTSLAFGGNNSALVIRRKT